MHYENENREIETKNGEARELRHGQHVAVTKVIKPKIPMVASCALNLFAIFRTPDDIRVAVGKLHPH